MTLKPSWMLVASTAIVCSRCYFILKPCFILIQQKKKQRNFNSKKKKRLNPFFASGDSSFSQRSCNRNCVTITSEWSGQKWQKVKLKTTTLHTPPIIATAEVAIATRLLAATTSAWMGGLQGIGIWFYTTFRHVFLYTHGTRINKNNISKAEHEVVKVVDKSIVIHRRVPSCGSL